MSDDYLYYHEAAEVGVTPNWFRMGNQSHAIHYLRRLTLSESSPPRKVAMVVFFIGLLLTIVQVIQIGRETLPPVIGWALLIACVILMLVSSFIAFVQTDKHVLKVDFNDGESVQLALPGKFEIKELHAALQEAMDMQPGGRLAESRGAMPEPPSDDSHDAVIDRQKRFAAMYAARDRNPQ